MNLPSIDDLAAAFSAAITVASVTIGALVRALVSAKRELRALRAADADLRPSVLIVDDNPSDRHLLIAALEPLNVQVIEAASAAQAIDILRSRPQPDVIVTDLRLPGLSGSDLIRRLRSPAVLMSAHDVDTLRAAARECDAVWLQKNGDVDTMRTVVARLLR